MRLEFMMERSTNGSHKCTDSVRRERLGTLRASLFAVIALASAGCSLQPQQCPGGFCGVGYRAWSEAAVRPPKSADQILLGYRDEVVPEKAKFVGVFEWRLNEADVLFLKTGTSGCPKEIEGFFRGKAANLGFDGVAGIQVVVRQGELGESQDAAVPHHLVLDAQRQVHQTRDLSQLSGTGPLAGAKVIYTVPRLDARVGFCMGLPYVLEP